MHILSIDIKPKDSQEWAERDAIITIFDVPFMDNFETDFGKVTPAAI